MTTQASQRSKKSGQYHHGDLRRDLLRIAREEIARSGASTLSLSSLARLARVSQPAPYRHFADRVALLECVAELGFQEFDQVLVEAAASGPPHEALQAMGLAYLKYGEANIELYRLMFASRLVPEAIRDSPLAKAADRTFDRLRRAVTELSPPQDTERDSVWIWAQLHGLLMLKADGFIDQPLGDFFSSLQTAPRTGLRALMSGS